MKSPALRLVSIYSAHGKLLGRAPLACLYAWSQAAFAIAPNGQQWSKPPKGPPDDEYCHPLDIGGEGGDA
jgi:hypothetical protein